MSNLIVGSNLPVSTGVVMSNSYSNVSSYLSTTSPTQIGFVEDVSYWLATTTLADLGLVLNSYAS